MEFLKKYKKLQKIGSSNNSVIYNADNQEALKVLLHDGKHQHTQQCQHLHNEAKLLKQLDHDSIIKTYQYNKNQSHKQQSFCCLSMELGDMDLFGLIEQTFPNKVDVNNMREFMRQICSGVKYLHERDICHNDLKLENILLFFSEEENNQVSAQAKIADFGFARNQLEKISAEEVNYRWNNRSNCSLAPEILRFKKFYNQQKDNEALVFDEKKAEIFTLGVMIFSAFFLRSPISSDTAHSEDKYYKYFYTKQYEKFWAHKDFQYELKRLKSEMGAQNLESLKQLLQSMLSLDCNDRPSIQQVMKHKWFQC